MRSECDESRAAVAAEAFRIAGRALRSLLPPPVYLMTFGCAAKGEVNYKIPAYKIPVNYKIPWKYLFSMLSHHSVRSIDKLPLPKNGWRDTDLGPRYYKYKQIEAPHIEGFCAVHARAQPNAGGAFEARSLGGQKKRIDRNRGRVRGSDKGSGKRSGERSRKGSDKSPGKGSGKGSGNAAEPPEPAASKTAKVVKGITMTWSTPTVQARATKRKESATREDPKAAVTLRPRAPLDLLCAGWENMCPCCLHEPDPGGDGPDSTMMTSQRQRFAQDNSMGARSMAMAVRGKQLHAATSGTSSMAMAMATDPLAVAG